MLTYIKLVLKATVRIDFQFIHTVRKINDRNNFFLQEPICMYRTKKIQILALDMAPDSHTFIHTSISRMNANQSNTVSIASMNFSVITRECFPFDTTPTCIKCNFCTEGNLQ